MAFDERLGDRMRDALSATREISEKRMFGGLCFLWRGKMFAGILGDELLLRIGPERQPSALLQPHVRVMDFTGKPMKGYIYVGPEAIDADAALEQWLQEALAFTQSLPEAKVRPGRRS